jgi:hypothetical protein
MFLKKITKLSFILLATIPLLKPNYNSIVIIITTLLTIYCAIRLNIRHSLKSLNVLGLILPFVLFSTYQIISLDFNTAIILRYLPFIIFPLIFIFKPPFINNKIKETSLKVFQISVIIQCLIYLVVFLNDNYLNQIFNISKENIPFFREYVSTNYFFEIHPTYFSSFLLLSFTVSIFKINNFKMIHFFNSCFTSFFILLINSRIIILCLVMTLLFAPFYLIKKRKKKKVKLILTSSIILALLGFSFSTSIVQKRFKEIKTEINEPIVGEYYNSTNTRIAILKCSFLLIKKVPFLGFGNNLQNELNLCYAENNASEFYKISVFNTHNFYLNLILYGGWAFLIFFILYLLFIFNLLKHSVLPLFIFFQFLIINLTENYLSRHYGIVLFSYFTSLFIFFKNEEKFINAKTKQISTSKKL